MRVFLHRAQCQVFEQSVTLKISLSVHTPYSRIIRVKDKKGRLPNAEVTKKTDTKGEAYRMFLHRDNPMQCQGFEQSVTLKTSLSVHAPYSRTIRVKHKKGGLPNAEVTQKTDTKGEACRMFLHRDNPMQCQGFEQSVTSTAQHGLKPNAEVTQKTDTKGEACNVQAAVGFEHVTAQHVAWLQQAWAIWFHLCIVVQKLSDSCHALYQLHHHSGTSTPYHTTTTAHLPWSQSSYTSPR